MIVLDASVLVAVLDSADLHHDAAVELLAGTTAPLMVHPLTLAEVLVGPARFGRDVEVSVDLEELGVEVAELGSGEALLLARARARSGLRMPDACVLATALHLNATLATFDARLAAAAGQAGLTVAPQ